MQMQIFEMPNDAEQLCIIAEITFLWVEFCRISLIIPAAKKLTCWGHGNGAMGYC